MRFNGPVLGSQACVEIVDALTDVCFALRWDVGEETAALDYHLWMVRRTKSQGIHDFYAGLGTQNWTVEAHNAAHQRDLNWLNARASELERNASIEKVMILTHWTPTRERRALHPSHRKGSKIESGFSTDLSNEVCCTSGKVKLWAFGHTHFNCDFGLVRAVRRKIQLDPNKLYG